MKSVSLIGIFIFTLTFGCLSITAGAYGKPSSFGFIENKGQIIDQHNKANPSVLFLLNTPGFNVQLRRNGFSYDVYTSDKDSSSVNTKNPGRKFHRVDINFSGFNPDYSILALQPSDSYLNYYTTATPTEGILNVRSYEIIVFKNFYPNIDLIFKYDEHKQFKYNFMVHPDGDLNLIRFQINGADANINNEGLLILETDLGEITEKIPESTLFSDSGSVPFDIVFKKCSQNSFGFSVPGKKPVQGSLLIDPVPEREWGTYFGGEAWETYYSIALDESQNIYLTGSTSSTTNIATTGAFQTILGGSEDVILSKFNASGSLIWSTYLGGTGFERGYSISLAGDFLYFSGKTDSETNISTAGTFQTTLNGPEDAFIEKFTIQGARIWGSYCGGSSYDGATFCYARTGNVYFGGSTSSSDVISSPDGFQPLFGGVTDAFLEKFDTSGQRIWGTYYGGISSDGGSSFSAINDSAFFITGTTTSPNNISTPGCHQPSLGGNQDGFIFRLDSNGQKLWGTYYGGIDIDAVNICIVHSPGTIYFAGDTKSLTNIATSGSSQPTMQGTQDGFIVKMEISGNRVWSTYYGGESFEKLLCGDINDSNSLYIGGYTKSSGNIASVGAYQEVFSGQYDGFVAKFDSNGSKIWGTYYGGNESDWIYSLCTKGNNIYFGGFTDSEDGIASPDGNQITLEGTTDAFLVKMYDCTLPYNAFQINGDTTVCENSVNISYVVPPIPAATTYVWNIPPGVTITNGQNTNAITVDFGVNAVSGVFTVYGVNSCGTGDSSSLFVTVYSRPVPSITGTDSICTGIPATFTTNPGKSNYTWNWSTGGALISGGSATDSAITLSWNTSGIHWVSVNYDDTNGCSAIDPVVHQIVITGDSTVDITIQSSANNLCSGAPVTFTATPVNGGAAPVYQWQVNGINTGTNNPGFTYTPANGDLVTCILTSSETVCISNNPATSNAITMVVNPNLPVSVGISATADTVCAGTPVTFTATPVNGGASPVYQWQVNGINMVLNSPNFTYTPSNGDIVICILTSSEICTANNPANSIPITVTVKPYLPVSITVTPSENPFCPGSPIIFTTTSTNGGVSPQYQWQVNGVNAGTNNPAFSYIPSNGDLVTCILTSSELCTTNNPAAGNVIAMQENTSLPAGIAITATPNPFCPGASVTLTASPVNGGTAPFYQWKVNGINTGANANVFTYTPSNNDSISCLLTSNLACVSNNPVYSNRIVMNAAAVPVVSFTSCFDTITTTNAQPIKLKGGIPLGGTYSGAGVTGNVYYPSVAGTGKHIITYSYTNTALCSATASLTIHQVAASTVPCGQSFTDIRDGAVYQTISLGSQCWMAEDLRFGSSISASLHQTDNCRPEKYTHPEPVYQWDELMAYDPTPASQGLCPPGWHVPTEADWNALFANWTNSGFAGSPLKYSGFSGFDAILSGARHHTVQWDYAGFAVFFWSSTVHGPFKAWAHGMNEADPSVSTYPAARSNAFGVRCVRDF